MNESPLHRAIARVHTLAQLDGKDLAAQALKLSEEAGEVAEAVLGALGTPGCAHKGKTRADVAEEAADAVICALAIALKPHANEREALDAFLAVFSRKLDKWHLNILTQQAGKP